MFHRLNRSVPVLMCLTGVALLATGCGETDDASTALEETGAADVAQAAATENDESRSNQDDVERAMELASRVASDSRRGDQPRDAQPAERATGDTARPTSARPSESADEPLFSPARMHEAVAAGDLTASDAGRSLRGSDRFTDEPRVEVSPALLDLGVLAPNATARGVMTLTNVGQEPVMIENSRTSCGCTAANVPRGEYIQPGESVDIEISLRGTSRAQVLTKSVTFVVKDHPPVMARVRGEVKQFVTMEPSVLQPDTAGQDVIVIQAEDEQPFRVTSMHPQITVEPVSDELATRHEFTIDWNQWRELGEARRLLFYTDHPKASQVMATVRVAAQRPATDRRERPASLERGATAAERSAPTRTGPSAVSMIQRGQTEQFLESLANGELDLNQRDGSGMTLVGIAARHGNTEALTALIEAGADVNTPDNNGRTPLMTAGQAKHPAIVKQLIEAGANLEAQDHTIGGTALSWTAGFGDPESLKLMLNAGADVDVAAGATGFTPLIWASGFGANDAVRLLIEAGADIDAVDFGEGANALMHAIRTGRTDNVRLLLEAGANLEATDRHGKTPIMWAAGSSSADLETIKMILEAGADLTVKDQAGLTVLDHARGRNDPNANAVRQFLAAKLGVDLD